MFLDTTGMDSAALLETTSIERWRSCAVGMSKTTTIAALLSSDETGPCRLARSHQA